MTSTKRTATEAARELNASDPLFVAEFIDAEGQPGTVRYETLRDALGARGGLYARGCTRVSIGEGMRRVPS